MDDSQIIHLLRDIAAKQDLIVDRVAGMEKQMAVDTATAKQARAQLEGRVAALAQKIDTEVMPHVNDIKRLKIVGSSLTGTLAFFGLTVGLALIYLWDVGTRLLRAFSGGG